MVGAPSYLYRPNDLLCRCRSGGPPPRQSHPATSRHRSRTRRRHRRRARCRAGDAARPRQGSGSAIAGSPGHPRRGAPRGGFGGDDRERRLLARSRRTRVARMDGPSRPAKSRQSFPEAAELDDSDDRSGRYGLYAGLASGARRPVLDRSDGDRSPSTRTHGRLPRRLRRALDLHLRDHRARLSRRQVQALPAILDSDGYVDEFRSRQAMRDAKDVDVINLSLGGYGPPTARVSSQSSSARSYRARSRERPSSLQQRATTDRRHSASGRPISSYRS